MSLKLYSSSRVGGSAYVNYFAKPKAAAYFNKLNPLLTSYNYAFQSISDSSWYPINTAVLTASGYNCGGPWFPDVRFPDSPFTATFPDSNVFPGSIKELADFCANDLVASYPNFHIHINNLVASDYWSPYTSGSIGTPPWPARQPNACVGSNTPGVTVPITTTVDADCNFVDSSAAINATGYYCLMDGTGTAIYYTYNSISGIESKTPIVVGGTDASVVNLLLSINGMPYIDGATGYINIVPALNFSASNLILSGTYSDDAVVPYTQAFDSINDAVGFNSSGVTPGNLKSVYYTMVGGGGSGSNNGSFSFPTGIPDDTKYINWSFPPLKTRIPFQNYSYSVANVILKGK